MQCPVIATDLKLVGVHLHKLFDNGRDKVDVTFLAHLTAHHQLVKRKIGRYAVEMPTQTHNLRWMTTLSEDGLASCILDCLYRPVLNETFLNDFPRPDGLPLT